jgi:CDP-diacylglycerol--glycerol-3-phosphate 3-phosphatidyltransferase
MRYIPNTLTVGRILLTPLLLLALVTPTLWGQLSALVLFMTASLSDYYDGKLARQMEAHSRLGRFLDPFADKVLVLSLFVMLSVLEPQVVPWWAVAIIVLRDVVVTGLRTWVESGGRSLRTLPAAKLKTTVQLGFIFSMLLLRTAAQVPSLQASADWMLMHSMIPFVLLLAVVGFTVGTGVLYVLYQERVPADGSSARSRP